MFLIITAYHIFWSIFLNLILMKRLIFLLFPLAIFLGGCSSDDIVVSDETEGSAALSLSSSAVSVDKAGGTTTVSIIADDSWTATSDASWLTVSPAGGSASTTAVTLTITASGNDSYSRSGHIILAAGGGMTKLLVSQHGESGGGVIDTGDSDTSEDNVANTTFDRTIYINFSNSGDASVEGDEYGYVTVSGNDVKVSNTGTEKVIYELSGTTSDGFFKLYSTARQALVLNGASITNKGGAAINIQSKKKTFVVVRGSDTLADCQVNSSGSYPDEISTEDMKAAFFSEGQLIFSGSGSLTVNASGKAAITSDDYVRFKGGTTVNVTATAGNGVRGKEYIMVDAGTINVDVSGTGRKGFSSDSLVYFGGGVTTIKNSGSAGTVDNELTGSAGIKADVLFQMNGGTLSITSTGTGGKGISCDGEVYFNGGKVTVVTSGKNYGTQTGGGMGGGSSTSSVSSKGIKFDGNLYFSGSEVSVTSGSHEGIESKGTIDISGGTVYSHASDDAINSASNMTITGGCVYAQSTGNDGLDANGNIYLKGGVVYAIGTTSPEVGIDANTEGGYKLYLTGGTIIAIGGIESGSSISQALVTSSSWTKSSEYSLMNGTTPIVSFKTPDAGGTSLVISSASLTSGSSYTLKSGVTISGGTTYFNAVTFDGSVSGGTGTTVTASTTYSGGGSTPGGGGGFPGR